MSGFVAAVVNGARPELSEQLTNMSRVLAYRGDRESTEVFNDRCAAVTRHCDNSGYRTHSYSDGQFAIVLDGLVLNGRELADAVVDDGSAGIARIVLGGYRKYGDSWLAKIDGSFALMIVNLRSDEVVLARDRFAHRPLYFGRDGKNVWVATEIKAINRAPGFRTTLNHENLHSAISYGFTPGPITLFENVYKCAPGFSFKINGSDAYHATDFYTPDIQPKETIDLEDAKEFVLSKVSENVGHYIRACPDLGVMLSGGVDSALLAHLASGMTDQKTLAISFGAEAWSRDESGSASEVAEQLGMNFTRTFVSPDDDLLASLRQSVWLLEEPTRFENSVALEMTTRDAEEKCTAIMTGEGADFILGEREHAVAIRLSKLLKTPALFRSILRNLKLDRWPSQRLRALAPYLHWNSIRDYGQQCSANCCDLVPGATSPPGNEIVELLANVTSDWPIAAQYTFMTLREAAHCWIERMEKLSAAAGLECFHPFESNDIFQFGLEMPDALRNAPNVTKPIVRSLAADLFDDEMAYRKKKQLAAPMQMWLNRSDQLRSAVLDLRKPDAKIRAYLNNKTVNDNLRTYEREGAQSETVAVHLFRILTFEIWLELFAP